MCIGCTTAAAHLLLIAASGRKCAGPGLRHASLNRTTAKLTSKRNGVNDHLITVTTVTGPPLYWFYCPVTVPAGVQTSQQRSVRRCALPRTASGVTRALQFPDLTPSQPRMEHLVPEAWTRPAHPVLAPGKHDCADFGVCLKLSTTTFDLAINSITVRSVRGYMQI